MFSDLTENRKSLSTFIIATFVMEDLAADCLPIYYIITLYDNH